MNEKGQLNPEEIRIQGVLDRFLNRHANLNEMSSPAEHLDDDSLTAFIEGNLSGRESMPIVGHLTECSFCRHITSELVKLQLAFDDEPAVVPVTDRQPSRVSEVLSGILSRIFGTSEPTVFAHHESEESDEEKKDKEKE